MRCCSNGAAENALLGAARLLADGELRAAAAVARGVSASEVSAALRSLALAAAAKLTCARAQAHRRLLVAADGVALLADALEHPGDDEAAAGARYHALCALTALCEADDGAHVGAVVRAGALEYCAALLAEPGELIDQSTRER